MQAHLKAVVWPFRASFLTLGAGFSRDGSPQMRSDVARREAIHIIPPSNCQIATIGLRDLDAPTWVHEKGRELAAVHDRRSHIAAAVECLIGSMIVMPKQLAVELGITNQAATFQAQGP